MLLNQKGEGKAGAIFGFAVFALVVYLGLKIIPVMINVYAFEDAVKEECKFLHGRTLDNLSDDLVKRAKEKNLPVTDDDVTLSMSQVESHQNLKVDIEYTVNIDLPFYVYPWKQHIEYDAPIFN